MRTIILLLFILIAIIPLHAQVKPNMIIGLDLYQWYKNPNNGPNEKTGASAGSFLFNVPVGLKILAGHNNFSFSVEGAANLGLFSFDISEFKGLGAVSFPFLAKLNFNGMSGFSKGKLIGWSIGGGVQYTKTELYGLTDKFDGKLQRKYFPTYVAEISAGGGVNSANLSYYVRIGVGPERAFTFNSGLLFNLNLLKERRKKPGQQSNIENKS